MYQEAQKLYKSGQISKEQFQFIQKSIGDLSMQDIQKGMQEYQKHQDMSKEEKARASEEAKKKLIEHIK